MLARKAFNLMLHAMFFNKNTLMNRITVGFLLLMHVNVMYIMGLFWGRYNLVSERTGFEYFGYVGSD